MILSILFACSAAPAPVDAPAAPPATTTPSTATTADGTPYVPEPPACIADPDCLHTSEAPFRWTFTPDDASFPWVWAYGGGELDYTGDGVADAVVRLGGVAFPGVSIVPGPLARDIALDASPIFEGVAFAWFVADVDDDGFGDMAFVADELAASGFAYGPFDLGGPTIPWTAASPLLPITDVLLEDAPGGTIYVGETSAGIGLYRGPFTAGSAPYATIVAPYWDIYQTDAWLNALPDGRIYLWNETEDISGCFALGDAPAGTIAPDDGDLVDDAACTAVGLPDQDGDGAADVWWDSAVYRSIAANHTPVDRLGALPLPLAVVADVSGDGVDDLVVLGAPGEVELRASGVGEPVLGRFGIGPDETAFSVAGDLLLVPTDGAIAVLPLVP